MPADTRCDLQRWLERGESQHEVVVLHMTLVGASAAGINPEGHVRPELEAALRRAIAIEAGFSTKSEHVTLVLSPTEMAGGNRLLDGIEEDAVNMMMQSETSSRFSQSHYSTSPQVSPKWYGPMLVCCIVRPPPGAQAGPLSSALGSRIATLGPGNKPALVVRVLLELTAVRGVQADPSKGIQVTDLTRPDVRPACLPDIRLTRTGVPPRVYSIFDNLQVFEDVRVVSGVDVGATSWSDLDNEEIQWALNMTAEVCKDPSLQRLLLAIATGLLRKDRRSCHRWCASIPQSALRHILRDNPVKMRISVRVTAVYEQQLQLASYLADCKLCVAFAAVAGDVLRRWNDDLSAEERSFLTQLCPKLESPQLSVQKARGIFDRITSRFIVLESLLYSKEPVETAMQQIRRMPKDILCNSFKTPWRSGHLKEGNFFYLYQALAGRKDASGFVLEEFVEIIALAYGASPPAELRAALKAFIADTEVAAWQRRDLFVTFVSVCRCPRQLDDDQPMRCCLFGRPSTKYQAPEQLNYPSTEGMEFIALEVILGEHNWKRTGTDDEIRDLELSEMLEAVLLVSTGDSLWQWSKDKLANDPRMAEDARRFLNGTGWKHISTLMKEVARSTRTTWYDDGRFRELAEGKRVWAHIAGKAASRFSEHAKALAKRPFEEFGQLLWMYFKLDFALDAGSLWNFMQTLEDGGEFYASRFNKLAPPGSALRMRMGEELQKAAGENQLELGEYDHLLKYFGFFNPSYQSFVRRGRALAESRKRFRAASSPSGAGAQAAERALDVFMGLLEATVKLISIWGAPSELSTEEVILEISDQCGGHHVHQRLFSRILGQVQEMDGAGAEGFGLEQLLDCARELGKSGQMLVYKVERKGAGASLLDGVCTAIQSLLQRTPPAFWADSLKGLDTVIFALEYMSKEDLDLAYEQFMAECRCSQQDSLSELVEAAKKIYSQPLAGSNPGSISPSDSIAEVIFRSSPPLEKRVMWKGAPFEPSDWRRILAIAGAAAETMRERYSVIMLPHHTQMITLVMFAIRTCGARFAGTAGKKLPKTMLARVGTGEGKSIVIAMLAAFAAKRGLRAHVINDNRVLAQRDFRANLRFFEKLGVAASDDRNHLKDKSCQVVYCTGDDVEKSCLESLIEGKVEEYEEGLKEAVLIVDEVDGLIFDKGTVSNEVFEDREFSEWVNDWLRQLDLQGEIVRDWEDFRSHGECSLTIQREVEEAYQQIGLRQEGMDYVIRGDMPYMIDQKTGLIKEDAWSLWLEVLKRHRRDGAYPVVYKHVKAILCRLQCFMSYSCIFGLTGSLGQTSEKMYLQEHYEAVTFNVPFFLDTCRANPADADKPLKVGSRVVVKTENSGGFVDIDRTGTMGLAGTIIQESRDGKSYTVQLPDGRTLVYKDSWVTKGRFHGRRLPQQIGNGEPLPNRETQEEAIIELALQKCQQVPVLIVMKDSENVQRLANMLRERLVERDLLPYIGAEEDGVIELLHNPRDPQDFVRRVELATEPLYNPMSGGDMNEPATTAETYDYGEVPSPFDPAPGDPDWGNSHDGGFGAYDGHVDYDEAMRTSPTSPQAPWEHTAWPEADKDQPRQRWRINVATAEGGRGHDYRITDPSIDDHGGLMLILTWVPWSEREWIQFLGRTGRQDHAGQYAVLLNGEDEQVQAAISERQPRESSVRAILRRGDQETEQALHGKRDEIEKGRLMHKFTSRYWTLHKVERTTKKQDWEWKRLCENYLEQHPDQIQQTFCSVIIPPKELILGFAKVNPDIPTREGLSELRCERCGTVNIFPSPGPGQRMPTVRCGHCGATSDD